MPTINVSASVSIEKSPSEVFQILNDFKQWIPWSPWLIMEPDVKLTFSDDSNYYHWEGDRVGAGEMTITGAKENETLFMDLTFLKPWKSEAKITFKLNPDGKGTHVKWIMDSSLPWFMFWMKSSMEQFIRMDFDRGLSMLKDYAEHGEVPSKLEWKGESGFTGTKYIGLKSSCAMDQVTIQMKEDFGRLGGYAFENQSVLNGMMFTIYDEWDFKKQQARYTVGFGIAEDPENLPDDFFIGEIPSTRIYTLRHIGPYKHLGNAWTTMMSMGRNKEFKQNKKIPPIEMYVNNPADTDEKDLITDIMFPVK
ncbi:MAG TPA: hypothetical protein DEQ34_10940 [Balneolaceae bacterium]|nr:hypothetical protein [Balneolaceae bacterium]|tara:strand:- start:78122 stop:79045 length:924 start_codon:yes stop_codon:yes gene_type:complete